MKIFLKIVSDIKNFPLPKFQTKGAAGVDLCAAIKKDITIASGKFKLIPTGIAVAIPLGYEGQVRPRSGLSAKHGVTVLNSPGTIDSDYRGEISVILANFGEKDFVVRPMERVAQMVVAKHESVDWIEGPLEATKRGSGGFGSTGENAMNNKVENKKIDD